MISQLFRKLLKEKGYDDDKDVIVEEQQTDNKKLAKLLQNASKSGAGKGFPDFIITCGRYPDLVILVECKADTKFHESATLDSYREYAIDGALLYASFVSKEYDVIAIGFSGEKTSLTRLSHYIQLNGEKEYHQLFNEGELLDIDSYHHGLMQSTFPIQMLQSSFLLLKCLWTRNCIMRFVSQKTDLNSLMDASQRVRSWKVLCCLFQSARHITIWHCWTICANYLCNFC